MKSVGWTVFSPKQDVVYEPMKSRPGRLYAKKSTAQKMASDWGGSDDCERHYYGCLEAREVFIEAVQ